MHIKKLDLDLVPQAKSRELKAKRRVLSKTLEGLWTALLKGRGMEFAGYRKYTPSDDASRIDWGASLRAKDTLVREFEEYRNVNVLFLVDVSDTMLFSSTKKMKAEHAAELTFQLGLSILENGDAVGYVLFSDKVVAKQLPSIGRIIVNGLASELSNPENYGGKKNFAGVVNTVHALIKQRALVIIVSDFIGMPPGWDKYIKLLSEKFDVMGIMIRDPRDRQLPDTRSQYLVEDPLSGERMYIDVWELREKFAEYAAEDEAKIKSVFDKAHAGLVMVSTDNKDMLKPILLHFSKRAALVQE